MENLLANQDQIMQAMEQLLRNFKKDSAERKTPSNIRKRLQTLDSYWSEFQSNHLKLCEGDTRSVSYFTDNLYQKTKLFYTEARDTIERYESKTPSEGVRNPSIQVSASGKCEQETSNTS